MLMLFGKPRRSACRNAQSAIEQDLIALRSEIEAEVGDDLPADSLGMKMWLLPEGYYRTYALHHTFRLSLLDSTALLLKRPRMRKVGELQGAVTRSSGTKWSIGKGLLSATVADNDPRLFDCIIHRDAWGNGIERLQKRDFLLLPAELRLGRSQDDFRRLRNIYGSAISVGVRPAKDGLPVMGCLTAHTPRVIGNRPTLSTSVAAIIAKNLYEAAPALLDSVLDTMGYKLP